MSKCILPIVLQDLHISGATFTSFNHFEGFVRVCVYTVGECSTFAILQVAVRLSQHHWLKRLSLLYWIFLFLCHGRIDCKCLCLFLGFLSSSADVCLCFCDSAILFSWLQLCSIVRSQRSWFHQFHFSYSTCFGYLRYFVFPYKFKFFLFQFCAKRHWQFDRDGVGCVDCMVTAVIWTMLSLPIQEHGLAFHLFVSSLIAFISVF